MPSYLATLGDRKIKIERSEKKICEVYNIPDTVFRKKSRAPEYSHARFAVWYLLHKVEGIPAAAIARYYGINHTSVIHGIERAIELGIDKEVGS